MTKQTEKKIGSFKPKDEKKKKSIWEYKEYILVGVIIFLAAIIFYFTLSNLGRNPANGNPTPTASPTTEDKDVGDLVVETDPEGAVAQVLDRTMRTPATFKAMKSGKYFVVTRFTGYKIHSEQVEIKAGETTSVKIKMEK